MHIPLTLLHRLALRRPIKQIFVGSDTKPYIERFFLYERNGWTYYLHRMLGPDPDRDLHNHPWKYAYSRVLYGSYIERRLDFGFQRRKIEHIPATVINTIRGYYYYNAVGASNVLGEHTWHTIVEVKEPETWTLFWHSEWFRPWGFLTEKGWEAGTKKTELDAKEGDFWYKKDDCKIGKEVMYGYGSR